MTSTPRLYRHRRWPTVLVVLLAIAVMLSAGAAAIAMWQAPGIVPLTPGAGSATNDTTPTVSFRLDGLGGVQQLVVQVDGRDVTATLHKDHNTATVTAFRLADGPHLVVVTGSSRNPLRDTVARTWQFTVDTVAPQLTVDEIGKGKSSKTTTFTGTTEPGATVTAPAQAKSSALAAEDGSFALEVPLKTDSAEVEFVATDRAGNATRVTVAAVGGKAPFMIAVAPTAKVLKTASPAIGYAVASGAPWIGALSASIDGRVVYSTLPAGLSSAMSSTSVPARSVSSVLKLHKLAQGLHELQFSATLGGQTLTATRTFVVNSTEKFGAATLLPGAIGADVKQLQKLLARTGFYKGTRDGVLGDSTVAAIIAFQTNRGMLADGIVGDQMYGAFSGHLIIDLSACRIYLYRIGKPVVSFPVAVGQPAYPTPTGEYAVVLMEKNPTWTPPNSPWAKGAVPIPPGENNPLGTRWIGTSAPGIGIHGTPDDASIGTHASHGCIRMHIPDVERLYEMVTVGMPVTIRP